MPLPKIAGIPCWALPIFAGFVWLVTLLSLIATWVVKGSTHYPEMWPRQHLPYISNIGASDWGHPLFIVGAIVTALFFSISFVSERRLRHQGRLLRSTSKWATSFWSIAAVLTTIGTCALVLLTIFCVRRHAYIHYSLVAVFAVAYIIAAAFISAEKWHLSKCFPSKTILRLSLRIKLFFIATEILLVVLGSITMYERMYRTAIVVEWMAALFFTFYLSSFAIDFLAVPDELEKDDGVQLLSQRWDEETGITMPTTMYILRSKKDTLIR